MADTTGTKDLLTPSNYFRANYVHQLRQTIAAYSASMITIGEGLQNAIDTVCDDPKPAVGKIFVDINFDTETVTIRDNGIGFPKDISLLYLGGTGKEGKNTKGKIGVGIKVTMFSSEYFRVRSNGVGGTWMVEITDAHKFGTLDHLPVPDPLPDDPTPLEERGTEITYCFPQAADGQSYLDSFTKEVVDTVLPRGVDKDFGRTISSLPTGFPSPFGALLASFLRRYSYVGDVLNTLGGQKRFPEKGIEMEFSIHCANPKVRFGAEIGSLFGDEADQTFTVKPSYLLVGDTVTWVPKGKKAPRLYDDKLGDGGTNLTRTDGFDVLLFASQEEYESLLRNRNHQLPPTIESYRKYLFPYINGILLTIGKIPDFDLFLPGGSRRVISCNGVVTSHDIDLTRGRNQEYVRCFDLIIDLNAELNYGKTQLTNMHLVKWTRDYVNEAYARVIQQAAGEWVGKIPKPTDEETDIYTGRKDLGLPEYTARKVPYDENDVIGLFFEMAGRGLFPGYRVFGLSQRDKYDCRAAILREADSENVLEPTDDTKLRVVEFKVHAADVIRDFDRLEKYARDIDLLIAWDIGNYESKNYSIYDIDQSNAYQSSPKRVFPGVTKYIYDAKEGSEVQILLLEDIVEAQQEKLKATE